MAFSVIFVIWFQTETEGCMFKKSAVFGRTQTVQQWDQIIAQHIFQCSCTTVKTEHLGGEPQVSPTP